MIDSALKAKCAAQALGTCRPTVADAGILRSTFCSPDSADGAGSPAEHETIAEQADSCENLGHWVPLLESGLGHAFVSSWQRVPKGLRALVAHTPLDVRRLAATFHSVQAGDSGCLGELDTVNAVQKWEPLGQLAATNAPAPVHEVLTRLGAVRAAASACAEVQQTWSEAARNGTFASLDSSDKPRAIAMQDLAALEWAGMECRNLDDKARTPLHLLCAIEGQKLIGDAVHNAAPATLARWFCARWPAALLVEDAEGLTPLNYLTPPLCSNFGFNGGSHRELLIAVAESFEHCLRQCPAALVSTLRCSDPLRTAVAGAARLGAEARHSSEMLPSLMQLAQGGAWECALMAWRNDTLELRERCREVAEIQACIRTTRILAGIDSTIPDQATLFERLLVDASAFAASIGCEISEEPVVNFLLEKVEAAKAKWRERQQGLEERLADLETELGRLPAAAAQSLEDAAPTAGLSGPILTPVNTVEPVAVAEAHVASLAEDAPQSFVEQEAEEFVNRMRRLRLVDANLDDQPALVRDGADRVRQVLVRAVERIAEDLYELESHFIYELVQNADDNSYPETFGETGPQCPTLRLLLRFDEGDDTVGRGPGTFFFSANNELGLRGEDVMALCDVNASSKKGKTGCTGQKGIGWKSTFQVSDCPYMLSGAFSFKFDIAGPLGRLGYVTPTWVGAKELAALPREVLDARAAGATVVYLPLRPGAAASVSHALEHLEEHHLCLLFMRRLRRLEMEYSDGRSATYARTGEGSDGQVCVTKSLAGQEVSSETLNYLVHSHSVQLPNGDRSHLSLAFPMTKEMAFGRSDGKSSSAGLAADGGPGQAAGSSEPPLQALYCGPPVRRVGFRFAINGPFDLVANRGDIHEGSAANRVLCEAIPVAFSAALRLHEKSIGPHTLAFVGQESIDGLWRRIRMRMLSCLKGAACVPTEEGGLATPEECVIRPSGALAATASWLIPAELLLKACGKRFAKGGQSQGALRGLGLEDLGLEHWEKILAFRGGEWPHGLVGAAARAGDGAGFFRPLLAWLEEEVRLAEQPGETLQKLWAMELWPSAEPVDKLMALCDGPILNSFCEDLPEEWQRTLCGAGALRVLDPRVRSALEGSAARFAAAVTAPEPTRSLVAGLCLEWHLLRFSNDYLRPAKENAVWASLACLMEAFHAGAEPRAWDTAGAVSPVAATETGKKLSEWSEVGSVLFFPAHGGMPPLARCAVLICPSYLGVPGLSANMAGAMLRTSIVPSSAAVGPTGLAPPLRFLSPRYLDGTWGDPLRWEAFLDALGMIRLSLRPGGGVPKTVCTAVAGSLGHCLADGSWWSNVLATATLSKYVCDRILGTCEEELNCLRRLPVSSSCGGSGGAPPLACVSGLFLHGSYGSLGSKFLPYAQLPFAEIPDKVIDIDKARTCLTRLGVTTVVTVQGLVQCLQMLKVGGCRDIEYFADLYKHIAQAHLAAGDQAISAEERQALSRLVLVPRRGFVDAVACTWEDEGLMQWLAEVPALEASYGRYGPSLQHFFVNIAGVSKGVESFHPKYWVHALKRIVQLVDEASCLPALSLFGSPISAELLLSCIGSLAAAVYEHLAAACVPLPDEDTRVALAPLEEERLVLLACRGTAQPKRVHASETWWDVAPEFSTLTSVTKLSLRNHYGNHSGLKEFFVKRVGVRAVLTREMLKEQLSREYVAAPELTHWGSISPADVEDWEVFQVSSHFRQLEEIDEDAEADNDSGTTGPPPERPTHPQTRFDTGFQPRRVPAWRRRQDVQEAAEEEARRARLEAQAAQQRREVEKKRRKKFAVRDESTRYLDNFPTAANEPPASLTGSRDERGSSSQARPGPRAAVGAKATAKAKTEMPAPAPPVTAAEAEKILRAAEAARARVQDEYPGDTLFAEVPAEHIQIIWQRIEAYEKEEGDMRKETTRLREQFNGVQDEIQRYTMILQHVFEDRDDTKALPPSDMVLQSDQGSAPRVPAETVAPSRRRRGFTADLERQLDAGSPTVRPASGSGHTESRFLRHQQGTSTTAAASHADPAAGVPETSAASADAASLGSHSAAAESQVTSVVQDDAPMREMARSRGGFSAALGRGAVETVAPAPANAPTAELASRGRRRGFTAALAAEANMASPSDSASNRGNLAHGDRVLVHGLQGRAELNGQVGTLTGFSEARGRYVVTMDAFDEKVMLRPENLQKASQA